MIAEFFNAWLIPHMVSFNMMDMVYLIEEKYFYTHQSIEWLLSFICNNLLLFLT